MLITIMYYSITKHSTFYLSPVFFGVYLTRCVKQIYGKIWFKVLLLDENIVTRTQHGGQYQILNNNLVLWFVEENI